MSEIHITPDLGLVFDERSAGNSDLRAAFARGRAAGVLALIGHEAALDQSSGVGYFADLARGFFRSFCAFAETEIQSVPEDRDLLKRLSESYPPMPGSEHIDLPFLQDIWDEMSAKMLREVSEFGGDGRKFLEARYPEWADVGKIFFHLAETRGDADGPFAFLATYSVRVAGKARVQHRPLGLALKDATAKSQNSLMERLLRPISEAARVSEFVSELVGSKQIYRKASLRPEQAFRFMESIVACENAGIVCKVPKEWQLGAPARAKVKVTVNTDSGKSHVGFNQLVKFDARVAIGDLNLSEKELKQLLAAEGPLVDFQGRWVQVDRGRIQKMLDVWSSAVSATHYSGGEITFGQALRALAGVGGANNALASQICGDGDSDFDFDQAFDDWVEVSAGPDFQKQLEKIRQKQASSDSAAVLQKHLKGKLRPYQERGLAWLSSVSDLGFGGCLADDMGLGKTIQVLAYLLLQKHQNCASSPSLLVVPASLVGNWQAEMRRFAPSLRYHADLSGGIERVDMGELDVVITTYGKVRRNPWFQEMRWHAVVADEAQALKNAQTKQSRSMRSLKGASKIAMTGTPVENNLNDLWSIFDFSCPGLLGSTTQFSDSVGAMAAKGDYSPLRQLIAPYMLRRQKTDKTVISDLPDKIEMKAQCYLSKAQVSLYESEVRTLQKSLAATEGMAKKGAVLRALMKFKQICNHPSQYQGNDSYLPADSGKFAQLRDLCEVIAAKQEKVLVFTQFRELTDILAHFLAGCFGRQGLVLHGGTPVKKRQGLVDQFSEPGGPPFFILSLKAGGTGLNLTAANHVIHFDRWWNPAVENQATDRAFRIGQRKKVLVHKFVTCGTIEEKIDRMIADKQGLSDAVISGKNEMSLTELSDDEIMDMVRLDINSTFESSVSGASANPATAPDNERSKNRKSKVSKQSGLTAAKKRRDHEPTL